MRGMDNESSELCKAINLFPGIRTIESCCGHGHTPYRVWFVAKNLKVLPRLIYYFAACHCGFVGWKVEVITDCGMSPVAFLLEGPIGQQAYDESKVLAELLQREIQTNLD